MGTPSRTELYRAASGNSATTSSTKYGGYLGRKNSHGSQCEHCLYARSYALRLYLLGADAYAP